MSRAKFVCMLLGVAVLVLSLAGPARAAQGRPTPEEMRQRMEQRMKESLAVTDDEWKALKPKVEKVQTLVRQVRGGGMGFRRPGETPAADAPEVEKKLADLQKLLQNKDSKAEDVAAALTAFREARTKAKAELEKAQAELKEGLTPRREAALVSQGLLE